jgi:hypothetical protein
MKKVFVLLMIITMGINMFAQDKPAVATEKNTLKVNTLALILTTGSVFYERKLSDFTSAQLGVGYFNYKISDSKLSGLFLTPEVRLYVRKNAIDGFYIAPYMRYMNLTFKTETETDNAKGTFNSYGGGVAFGRQWVFTKGFLLDLFFGGHYTGSQIKLTSGTSEPDLTKLSGFRMRVGFNIGFAF